MLLYQRFFHDHGCRLPQHLLNPIINLDLSKLALPQLSIFNYLPEDSVRKGIMPDHWAIKDSERLVMIEHITQLSPSATEGAPRRNQINADLLIREYHRQYKKLKRITDLARNTRDPKTPVVFNYALLRELYRYSTSVFTQHYQQRNIYQTLWDNIVAIPVLPTRQHFIEVRLPTPLPSLAAFKIAETKFTHSQLAEFNTPEDLLILELYHWLGENRASSQLSKLTDPQLHQINIVIIHDHHWLLLNLGVLDSWRATSIKPDDKASPEVMQKRFLRMLISLFESTSVVNLPPTVVTPSPSSPLNETTPTDTPVVTNAPVELRAPTDEELEADLDAVRSIAIKKSESEATIEDPFSAVEPSLEQGILSRAEKLADEGLLSAAEYRRYEKVATLYKEIKDPYTGKGSLVEASTVLPEETVLKPEVLQDHVAITDKSMLLTTVGDFNAKYTKTILKKDVMGCILNFNRAGIAVTDYSVERMTDVANDYENHTVKLTPVGGRSSTIRFKIPVIQDDGTFTSNTVRYRMRKQRADVPIRKVGPGKVALTSYYGKVFVERSSKVVNSYSQWLTDNIRDIGLDPKDERVTNLKIARVIKETLKAPRLYTILGNVFRSFTCKGVDFYFIYDKRMEHFGEEVVKKAEKQGMVMLGVEGSYPIVVDDNLALYRVEKGELVVLGNIESFIGIELKNVPVEVAELAIFSKSITLGIVLSYYLGINKLIKSLPGKVKQYPSGEKFSLLDNEYAVYFSDITLIVSREDQLTSLILGGFNTYKNLIKQYNFRDFDKNDVFFNIFDSSGLSNRYLKELDLMRDMFIDPITLEILKEMKEPTTWLGLLRRATELLLNDFAPQEVDMEFMRIRGYERIAGAVYLQMIQSMRGFMARQSSSNAAVEMKPFAVWQTINGDPSVFLVEDSNPVRNINEQEMLTFMGVGGRGRTSLVDRTRIFNDADIGVVSEATVDGGDVAVNTYTTANPKLISLRGLSERYDSSKDSATSLMSTPALLSPGAVTD